MTNFIDIWQLWALVFIICLIAELFSGGFFIICFAIGTLFATLSSFVGGLYVQVGTFIVFTAISIFWVRPFALRYLHKSDKNRKSNADALMGRIGTVSQSIPLGGFGRVAIDGDDWKAQAGPSVTAPLSVGDKVRVVGRESIIIMVEKVEA